jgi:hypothetical protein
MAGRAEESGRVKVATNDAIVLQANFSGWKKDRADGLTEANPWVYYCISQFVKSYELNDDEILYGLTEGGHDGGADGIYFIVNHRILVRDDTSVDPKSITSARVIIIQVKEADGFKPTEIDKHIELANDFFDLAKPARSLNFRYNENVIKQMAAFKDLFLKISGNFPGVAIDFYYVTGADVSASRYAQDSAARVRERIRVHLSRATSTYNFIGAQQLWEPSSKAASTKQNLEMDWTTDGNPKRICRPRQSVHIL